MNHSSAWLNTGKSRSFTAILASLALSGSPLFFSDYAEAQVTESKKQTAQAVGNKKKTLAADTQTAVQPVQEETKTNELLRQVVITATGFEQTVKDAPASVSVISREQIENSSFHDLTDALRNIQGVAVTGKAGAEDISMRGLPGSYTLILVDGKRQSTREARTNGNAGYEQSFIPPAAAIERIEVVRGSMSSLYGSDAMGGVINIITRKVPEKWTGSFTVDGTANQHNRYGNSLQGSYYIAGPLAHDIAGVQVWGRGFGRQEDSIVSGVPEKKEVDITGRFTITPDKNNEFNVEGGHTRLRRYSSVDKTIQRSTNPARPSADTYNANDRDHWSADYTGRFGWTTAELSVLQEVGKRTNYRWDSQKNAYVANLRSPGIRNNVVDGKLTTPFQLYGMHTLVTGGQYNGNSLTDQNPGMRDGRNRKFAVYQWALFGEDEWWITDSFALTGGLRMDNQKIYGKHWTPRGYAVWHATENLTLKGGVSTGFRAPEIRDIAPGYAYTTGGAGCFYGRNPPPGRGRCAVIITRGHLKAEKSTNYEFSALWDNLDNLQLGATYFYTNFRDRIVDRRAYDANGNPVEWDVDPNYVIFENVNIDRAVMQGVEVTASWKPVDALTFRANYTWTDSKQKTGDYAGFPFTRTPKHMGNLRADWITPLERLQAWAAANYHGKETNAGFRAGGVGKPVYKNGKVVGRSYDGYLTFDIGTTYAFNDKAKLNAAIYNLFDKKIDVDRFNTIIEGRRFWVAMTASF